MFYAVSNQLKKTFSGRTVNAKAILAVIIFGMIIMVFIVSDFTGRRGGGRLGPGIAAEVNGQIISIKDFQQQESRISAYYSQLFGGKLDNEFQRKQILMETMNQLINNSVAAQAAEKEKIYVTDFEVRKMITEELPYFKRDGVFQSENYKALLAANRLTPAEFENDLRQQGQIQKVRSLFETALNPTKLNTLAENELKAHQLNVAFIKFDTAAIKNAGLVSSAEVNQALANKDFVEKLKSYYESKKAEFETPEEVKAAHILIKANAEDAEAVKAAKLKAEEVLKKASKEDFGKLAAQYSDDPGSKNKKGELGFFARGRMVKEFEDAAFALNKGQVSNLVQTPFGFHIIKVLDKKSAQKTSFEQAQMKLAQDQLSSEKAAALAKDFETVVAKGDAQEIEAFVAKNKLAWSETGYFDIASEVFPQTESAQLFRASLELTKDKPYSKVLYREGDSQFLLKFKDAKLSEAKLDPKMAELGTKQKAYLGFQNWVSSFRKKSSVSTNDMLFQQQN